MDVRALVMWLGPEGAKSGLLDSREYTVDHLKELAKELEIKIAARPKRADLVDEIVRIESKRIDKPLDQLFTMSEDDLVEYFKSRKVERSELLDLLKELDVDPGREGHRNLMRFVAREMAETGRFMRIATEKKGD